MELSDTDDIISWRNKPRVRNNFIYRKPFTREGHHRWIENMIDTGKAVQFVIMENSTDKAIGSTYLRDIDLDNRKAEFGIFIGVDEAVNRGYGTEACKLICNYGFEFLRLHRIFLRVFEWNLQAINSYKNAGFVREGLFRDDVCIDGEYHNIVIMGMLDNKPQGGTIHEKNFFNDCGGDDYALSKRIC
ncbi:MAG: GNAT family N-acetyltransferase [Selenomonadaceae bacterium]|nr:GNAT family N-acetyltransferase [Selenomonadaceae bacterium]